MKKIEPVSLFIIPYTFGVGLLIEFIAVGQMCFATKWFPFFTIIAYLTAYPVFANKSFVKGGKHITFSRWLLRAALLAGFLVAMRLVWLIVT